MSLDLLKVGAGLVLTAPFTPMLFMGEEWGASTPWQYFTDHRDAALGQAVSDGRRTELARHGWPSADMPDPQDPATFARSTLDWSELDGPAHRELLAWYRQLIALRGERPELTDPGLDRVSAHWDDDGRWIVVGRGRLRIAANLGAAARKVSAEGADGAGSALLAASKAGIKAGSGVIHLPPASFAVLLT